MVFFESKKKKEVDMPASKEKLPSTLERSPKKVRKTYEKTLDAAHEQYDSEERAHRTAWDSVKHVAEKKGDHWELKDRKGPSDAQAAKERGRGRRGAAAAPTVASTRSSRNRSSTRTPSGAGIEGRSRMSKQQLVVALEKRSPARDAQGGLAQLRARGETAVQWSDAADTRLGAV